MFYEVIWFLGMSSHSQTKGQVLSVGAFVGGELYPSWMHFFQALYCLYFSFIAFLSFLLQGLTRGHCLGLVARADSVTHWYLRRNDKAGS
jgi:hypothetical protein